MTIQVTLGQHFAQDEQVTPEKLNNLVDLATITNIPLADVLTGPVVPAFYGSTAPTLRRGQMWYDTTPGYEGFKYAFLSASNSSVSKWLYRTPHWDGIFWADSGATLGCPQYLAPADRPSSGNLWVLYDGHMFPRMVPPLPASNPSGSDSLACVIPLESVAASRPCVCAIVGMAPGNFLSTITAGHVVISSYTPTGFLGGFHSLPFNRSSFLGLGAAPIGSNPGVSFPSWLFLGVTHQDSIP